MGGGVNLRSGAFWSLLLVVAAILIISGTKGVPGSALAALIAPSALQTNSAVSASSI